MRIPIPRAALRVGDAVRPLAADAVVDPRSLVTAPLRRRRLPAAVRGRRILVTGASSGIGKRVAHDLAEAGATVLLLARRREQLEHAAEEIRAAGGAAHVHPADLADSEDTARVAAEILDLHGGVDVLVNNAGLSIRRALAESYDRAHDFERTMAINYFGPVRLTLAFLPGMRERRFGHIVNVLSQGLAVGPARFPAYLASKGALEAFARSMAPEVIGDGVHVTDVYMPLVRTPMISPTRAYDAAPALSVRQASRLVCEALVTRDRTVNTPLGTLLRVSHAVAPKQSDRILGIAYRSAPEPGRRELGTGGDGG